MTKEEALQNFWGSFEIPAYEENSVPTGKQAPQFPYITYQVSTSDFDHDVHLTGSLWYRDSSWVDINRKTREIADKISTGLKAPIDNGVMQIYKDDIFAQSMGDSSDDLIKRKVINLIAEFQTAY